MSNSDKLQFVDPAVTRAKFDQEVALYQEQRDLYQKRGCFLTECNFPDLIFLFSAPQLHPSPVLFGARINFTNYDLEAPSLCFINPFTGAPYLTKEFPHRFNRRLACKEGADTNIQLQPLIQSHGTEELPFLCIPGIREYHKHPAHTGNSWLLHRKTGEGSLAFILDKILLYGVKCFGGFQLPGINANGLALSIDPNQIPG